MYQASETPLRKLAAGHRDFLLSTANAKRSHNKPNDVHASFDATAILAQIPKATALIPELVAIGLPPTTAWQISDAYLKSTNHLWDICQSSLRNAYTKASSQGHVSYEEALAMTSAWAAAYAQQTGIWSETALSRARGTVAKAKAAASTASPTKERKPGFNHEYTPLLEKYFQYNAYPSGPDRAVLARKSMMTPRQIEVWFQNHRNRAKKEGKVLRKLTEEPLPSELSLISLEREMPFFTIPASERKVNKKPDFSMNDLSEEMQTAATAAPSTSASADSNVIVNPIDPPPPPQAFPAVYVPRDVDAFSANLETFQFPPPLWYRKPASQPRSSPTRVDMNELIIDFNQKLHLRAPEPKLRGSPTSQPWCAGRYIPLCRAPHPALIRSSGAPTTCPFTKPFSSVPATMSLQHAFRSPNPSSSAAIPIQLSDGTPARRKTACLPKRIPKHKSAAHRRGSPAISEGSPEPSRLSSSTSSRVPSFESDASSRRPSSSSSSSSSSSPTTPVSLASALPEYNHSPRISVSGVDFEDADDVSSDTSTILSMGAPFVISAATQTKHRFAFGIDTPATYASSNRPSWSSDSLS
ncbi:hypothetical protein DXG01_009962 [Tephrocybe rancida]|nr:hypothetical protein DXG01_009962 [Tephrocybe rancida]